MQNKLVIPRKLYDVYQKQGMDMSNFVANDPIATTSEKPREKIVLNRKGRRRLQALNRQK